MLTLKQIQARLADRRIDKVAEATGLHYNTVRNIREGVTGNPSWRVVKALSDYLAEENQ